MPFRTSLHFLFLFVVSAMMVQEFYSVTDEICLAMNEKESFVEVHLDVKHSELGSDMTLNISNINKISFFCSQNM